MLFTKRRNASFGSFFKALDFYFLTGFGGINYSIRPNEARETHGLDDKGFAAVIPVGFGSSIVFTPDVNFGIELAGRYTSVSYTHLRAHETVLDLVCRLLLEKKKQQKTTHTHHKSKQER